MCQNCKKPYYITTAIAYASGKPHIGNTYEIVLADSIARYKRAQGCDVFFQTGTDEHGQKIEEKAQAAGVSPKEFVDKAAEEIKRIWDLMNTSYDKFIRTTDADHEAQVQKIFKRLYDQGDIYKGYYEGMYCTPCESFFTESQLVDGKCPDCGREVKPAKEEAYFFRMSKYAPRLIEHINAHPEFIQPVSRKNEMMNNFLLPGLQDLCVSRTTFSWGIPVTFDPKHVTYVWLDALTNYITGIGYDCDGDSTEQFKKYWPADLHLIGKDIIRFHTIYWPIFLMALGVELPKQVFGHPWLLQGDGKMSKSKGNVLYADTLVDFFGVDAVRYFVLHEMPFDNDGVISWELMVERMNSDLANILGNLVNRTISMSNKYFGGIVADKGAAEAVDEDLKATVLEAVKKVEAKMEQLRVADAITEIFNIFRRSNKYIDETTPWTLAKDEAKKDRLATVLYNLSEAIAIGASLLEPFMPETSGKILAQLNTGKRELAQMDVFGMYESGTKVTDKPEILFARMDIKEVMAKVEEMNAANAPAVQTEAEAEEKADDGIDLEAKPEITYDDFAKLQFQIGEIIACEAVPKSKKLLCSQVKVGSQVRQILSGIKAYYSPEEMVGKKVMVVTNLKPAKLAGMVSEGMLLCAEDAEGNLALMRPEKDMPAGAGIS
ncbi:methionine--tRNA ligase [Clostridium sp. AF18-27]|mgnify:CR=1 FL=1|uniref:Methionine--tRNA ligase n=2 Tax=Enterocloster lavalensis TaxID=460384 RepID=A0A1I0HSW4_9FIRM|nr:MULTISPECIES: methionine--tRNA ligase [Enterocloster]MDR3759131.1 methionine--tRNA ligase [Enterocloster sp.]PST32222.1 methionine--tRNA ligase [Enterocloster lavalensis]RHR56197.1 methionine--tRNA ligase [Clostridium sp. AF18-27]SET87124.1 methionyl-tRNA synthetase [Enterocloster lavalensis]